MNSAATTVKFGYSSLLFFFSFFLFTQCVNHRSTSFTLNFLVVTNPIVDINADLYVTPLYVTPSPRSVADYSFTNVKNHIGVEY